MCTQTDYSFKKKQRGQSIALLALSIVSLLGMAALAVDVTTLYVARTEMQRAADAAALAGAKGLAFSGVTTVPSDTNLQDLATTLCNNFINVALAQNKVGGVTPVLAGPPNIDSSHTWGNPQVTVKVQRTDVPTFFSRVFTVFGSGAAAVTVSATATAEAYNSSNPDGRTTPNMPPVAPSFLKPWLVANLDPLHLTGGIHDPFVKPDGSVQNPGVWVELPPADPAPGFCAPGGSGGVISECITLNNLWTSSSMTSVSAPGYLPAKILTAPSGICPTCAAGGSNIEQSVACSDTAHASLYACGATTATLDTNDDKSDIINGAACLMNPAVPNIVGPDNIYVNDFDQAGGATPMRIHSETAPQWGHDVLTSKQVVTLPIVDPNLSPVRVVGYMQAFLQATTGTGGLVLNVLNISGCGGNVNTALPPVSGGTSSPVPVRLIH